MRSRNIRLITSEREGVKADYGVHLDLCIEILKLVMTEETSESSI